MRWLCYFAVAALLSPPTVSAQTLREFLYKKTPQGELKLYAHFPSDWKPRQKRPAIVFFFGGGFRTGSPRQFRPQAEYLAARGMVAFRADYRVSSRHGVTADACVEDAKSAVRWIREHARSLGVDPDRLVASGGSAGGHLAAATALVPGFEEKQATVSSRPNLLVLFNPVLNTAIARSRPELAPVWRQISPNHFFTRPAPPTLIFFGDRDRLLATGREYMQKARRFRCPAWLYVAAGQRHGFFNREPYRTATLWLVDRFLARYGYVTGEPTLTLPAEADIKLEASSAEGDFLPRQQ